MTDSLGSGMQAEKFEVRSRWSTENYSTPADRFCYDQPPSPDANYRCVREINHPGKCKYVWSPVIKSKSWKDAR